MDAGQTLPTFPVSAWPWRAINRTRKTVIAGEVRFADRFFSRLRGLLMTPTQEFARGRGLWICPSKGVHMWGMRYAIDAVYLDKHERVVHIEPELQPWQMGALRREAVSVLELPAGVVAATGTRVGDAIGFCFGTQGRAASHPFAGQAGDPEMVVRGECAVLLQRG